MTHENAAGAGTPSGDRKSVGTEGPESTNAALLAQALHLAGVGFHVLPCRNDKAPACRHGLHDATVDPDKLSRLFAGRDVALIGIRTGGELGVAVLDLDGEPGLSWLARERASLPITIEVRTRRRGMHFWYRLANGMAIPPTTAGKIASGVDTRGAGGYAIAWAPELLTRRSMAPWPGWLTDVLRPSPRPAREAPRPRIAVAGRYEASALIKAIQRVAAAPEGLRNATLNAEAFSLARLPTLDPATIRHAPHGSRAPRWPRSEGNRCNDHVSPERAGRCPMNGRENVARKAKAEANRPPPRTVSTAELLALHLPPREMVLASIPTGKETERKVGATAPDFQLNKNGVPHATQHNIRVALCKLRVVLREISSREGSKSAAYPDTGQN